MNKYFPWRDLIVQDFYRELNKNEDILNYPHFRALIVIGKKYVICNAILNKPKKRKMWVYTLDWLPENIRVTKYVAPFRATKKNRELFNKKSRALAKKLFALLEKSGNSLM